MDEWNGIKGLIHLWLKPLKYGKNTFRLIVSDLNAMRIIALGKW